MKYVAGFLLAVSVAWYSGTVADGDVRDLWIGVIQYDLARDRQNPARFYAALEPVAALVDGKWWFNTDDDVAQGIKIYESMGRVPAQWLPHGTDLPTMWQAHFFDGKILNLRTAGPLHVNDIFDHLVVTMNLELPRLEGFAWDYESKGIALAGDVDVRLFTQLQEQQRSEVFRFLATSMLTAERAEIQARASAEHAMDVEKAAAKLSPGPFDIATFAFETARTATQRDGSVVYLVEGARRIDSNDDCPWTHTGAAAIRDSAGALRALGAWSYLSCNELHVSHEPLALLERNGASCWLFAHVYEDGIEYTLSRPGLVDLQHPACDLK